MLKQRAHIPAGWAAAVLKCGVVALGAAVASGAMALTSAQAATAPTATPVHGTVTGNDVNVRALPSRDGKVLRKVNKGDHVDVYCHLTTDVAWDRIKVEPQEWVAANYVNLGGKTVPRCETLALGEAVTGMAATATAAK